MKNWIFIALVVNTVFFFACETTKINEMKAGFDWQGHRGCRGILPENSIASFLEALKYPVQTLEMDVVVSKDNQVIVSHEPWMSAGICSFPDGQPVDKSLEDSLLLMSLTYEEIKLFDCGKRGNSRFPSQKPMPVHKPSLADAVSAIEEFCTTTGRDLPKYNIEIKSEPEWDGIKTPAPEIFAQLVIDQIINLGIRDRVCIQSFDSRSLRAVRQIDSTIVTALLVANSNGVDGNIKELGFTPNIYSPNYSLITHEVVERTHKLGMTIVPWTINDTLVMKQMIQMGVDGIITDYPNYIEGVEKAIRASN